ncbi:ThiF family adenylyltransferase [Halodesulfovibrio marinisediminis]|uniref:Sulfur carrier protein ThiS adenylyltransferase n=1 Tax=Halodesulfovibrio marinisediminis DSM 17456 TaxID=1121457 RepID=A0A1N6DCP5_9BACT|nr:ThiF family adenylyltransferase [Halodesulfovibrio marinisediminis]SIN68507.1 sulfur carrier protein ThiS adenylyltransferase [Halodesulfovibrio marinisediminis DSM 17456]
MNTNVVLSHAIEEASESLTLPNGEAISVLTVRAIEAFSKAEGTPLIEIEKAALKQNILPERYVRNFSLISMEDQYNLLSSKVFVVGLGGLGGYVVEQLARLGVGTIVGADGDFFEPTNLNRQLNATFDSLGEKKAKTARRRLQRVNPTINFIGVDHFLRGDALIDYAKHVDVVVDCLGGLDTRLDLQQAAAVCNVPMVTAAVAGLSGYVGTILPGQTGPAELFGSGGAAEDVLGTPASTVAMAASLQVNEVLKTLCWNEPSDSLLFYDLMDMSFQNVTL